MARASISALRWWKSRGNNPIFKHLHHEPVDFRISEPELSEVQAGIGQHRFALANLLPEASLAATN
jgi:hypothetical protein